MARTILGLAVLTGLVLWPSAWAQVAGHRQHPPETASAYIRELEDPSRDAWQEPEKVIEKLALKPGDVVVDLGAGSGYFTVRMARAVGPGGKVIAVDVDSEMISYIESRKKDEGLENIETILAEPHDPKLAPSSVDLIFICDTLHHISERGKYYPLLARALKRGGRLVNVDFEKRPMPIGPPVEHKIAKEDVGREVAPAGFRLIKDFDFLKYQYFLVFALGSPR